MARLEEQYVVDKEGQRRAIILPIEEYEELLEDLHDLAVIAERRDEPVIPFEELKKRLRKDGLL
jgi:PHD/YefM family antitoxin component YafN of YafNO toxin-antitoxin module